MLGKAVLALMVALVAFWFMIGRSEEEFDWGSVSGKRVLVTGASSGIGEEMAGQLCRHGARLVITARRVDRLKQVVEKCAALTEGKAEVHYVTADMGNLDHTKTLIERTVSLLGGLDQLILNHGFAPTPYIFRGTDDHLQDHDRVLRINLQSSVYLASYALPHLEQSSGSIGVVGSDGGRQPTPAMAAYAMSKHALDGFFGSLRLELALMGTNVSVTYCTIGLVENELGLRAVDGMCDSLGLDKDMMLGFLPAAPVANVASAIIQAVTKRSIEIYYPPNQRLFEQIIYNRLFPHWTEGNYDSLRVKHAET